MDTSPHILVVDDHREIREPLARYLERHALRVTVAESAAVARRANGPALDPTGNDRSPSCAPAGLRRPLRDANQSSDIQEN